MKRIVLAIAAVAMLGLFSAPVMAAHQSGGSIQLVSHHGHGYGCSPYGGSFYRGYYPRTFSSYRGYGSGYGYGPRYGYGYPGSCGARSGYYPRSGVSFYFGW